jgi:serine/threonine protein kinase
MQNFSIMACLRWSDSLNTETMRLKSLKLGRYKILESLASTLNSTVYVAYDNTTEERVAIKILSFSGQDREMAEILFRRETQALKGIKHPAIVRSFYRT